MRNLRLSVIALLVAGLFCLTVSAEAAEATRAVQPRAKPGTLKIRPKTVTPVITKKADLIPQSISILSGVAKVGRPLNLSILVWNTGKVDSVATTVSIVLRQGTTSQTQNPPYFSKTVPLEAVTPNMAKVAKLSTTLTNYPPGFWTIEARVDPQNKVIESNKIVPAIDDAIRRVKQIAAPANAIRHTGLKTPCMKTAVCMDCQSPDRICNTWCITEKSFPKERIKIILINQDLGL